MPIITYREALRQALGEELERDPDVFVIGEEVAEYQGTFRVTEGLLQRFGPRRVVDAPISEEGFTAVATPWFQTLKTSPYTPRDIPRPIRTDFSIRRSSRFVADN